MQQTVIHSLSEYIQRVTALCALHRSSNPMEKILFRGHSSDAFGLVPYLGRNPADKVPGNWQTNENNLVLAAQQKFPSMFTEYDIPVILLAKMQHYGVPTRLLDLSENALVALYFACKDDSHADCKGEVLLFNAELVTAYDPYANAIADSYRLTGYSYHSSLEGYYYRVMHQQYAARLIYPGWEKRIPHKSLDFAQRISRPLFLETGNLSERQKNQFGYFMIFPNEIQNENGKLIVSNKLVEMSKEDSSIMQSILIPPELKSSLLEQLRYLGITESFLFADNPDKVLRCMVEEHRRQYMQAQLS